MYIVAAHPVACVSTRAVTVTKDGVAPTAPSQRPAQRTALGTASVEVAPANARQTGADTIVRSRTNALPTVPATVTATMHSVCASRATWVLLVPLRHHVHPTAVGTARARSESAYATQGTEVVTALRPPSVQMIAPATGCAMRARAIVIRAGLGLGARTRRHALATRRAAATANAARLRVAPATRGGSARRVMSLTSNVQPALAAPSALATGAALVPAAYASAPPASQGRAAVSAPAAS
jgi:hypothetical protein